MKAVMNRLATTMRGTLCLSGRLPNAMDLRVLRAHVPNSGLMQKKHDDASTPHRPG